MANLIEILSHTPVAISVLFNAYLAFQLQKKNVLNTEYKLLEETCERQRGEIKAMNQEIGSLKERTDLQPLMQTIVDWRNEGRERFTKATEQLAVNTAKLSENTEALRTLIESHHVVMRELFPARQDK